MGCGVSADRDTYASIRLQVRLRPDACLPGPLPPLHLQQQVISTTPTPRCRLIAARLAVNDLDTNQMIPQLLSADLLRANSMSKGLVVTASHAGSRTWIYSKLHLFLHQTWPTLLQTHDQPFSVASLFKGRAPKVANARSPTRVTHQAMSLYQQRPPVL